MTTGYISQPVRRYLITPAKYSRKALSGEAHQSFIQSLKALDWPGFGAARSLLRAL